MKMIQNLTVNEADEPLGQAQIESIQESVERPLEDPMKEILDQHRILSQQSRESMEAMRKVKWPARNKLKIKEPSERKSETLVRLKERPTSQSDLRKKPKALKPRPIKSSYKR